METNRPLYSYFQEDSVVGLVLEGTNVRLKKAGGKATDISGAKFATFTLVEADGIALNAKQINTKLGIQDAANGVKLTFNPDRNNTSLENPFSDVAFIAKDTKEGSFVYVTRKADNQYLHVDTAYTNKNSDKFLAFNYKKALSTDLADQGKFLFTYFPSHDSLVIQVKQATRLSASVKDWKTALTTPGNHKTIIANNKTAKNYVTIQDLVKADEIRIVTIADVKETDITLGFTGCVQAGTDKVSLEDGLYVKQNVMHMPAYQWVVLKTKTSEYFLSTSPVNVTNREYPSLKNPAYNTTDKVLKNGASWQLTQAEGSKLYYCKALSSDSLVITKITDKNILGDKYLGYKYLTDDELMITNYAFNYFNPYTMDKYIAQVEGDTTLNALQEEATFFELVKQNNNKTVDKILNMSVYEELLDTSYKCRADPVNTKTYTYGYTVDAIYRQESKVWLSLKELILSDQSWQKYDRCRQKKPLCLDRELSRLHSTSKKTTKQKRVATMHLSMQTM